MMRFALPSGRRVRQGGPLLSVLLSTAALAEPFHLLTGVDVQRWPGTARAVTPQPGPGFANNFYDGDRLAGTSDVGPVVAYQGDGVPMFQPNQFGCMSFTLRRGSVPAPPFQIPLMGIDFLGGPLLDLDGDVNNGARSLVPVTGEAAVAIPDSTSLIDLTLNSDAGTISLNGFDATGTNEGGPGISAEIAVTLTVIAGTEPNGESTGPINPFVDRREGELTAFTGTNGTLAGVYRVTNLGYELWQDTLLANSSTASELGTFQFLGTFRGWVVERNPATGDFPAMTGQGMGGTLWPMVDASRIGQSFETATTLPGGPATIFSGYPGDNFTAPSNGGLPLTTLGGDLGAYFDQVVVPRIDPLADRFVYLESAGFGINNSSDPIYLDTVAYDVVVVAQIAPVVDADPDYDGDVDLRDFAAFQGCFTGAGAGAVGSRCNVFDFDFEFDVDLADFDEFRALFTGAL